MAGADLFSRKAQVRRKPSVFKHLQRSGGANIPCPQDAKSAAIILTSYFYAFDTILDPVYEFTAQFAFLAMNERKECQ